jgi:restriction endonuclease Mrr
MTRTNLQRRISNAARPRQPWLRIWVSPWWAKVLYAGGARRPPAPDAMTASPGLTPSADLAPVFAVLLKNPSDIPIRDIVVRVNERIAAEALSRFVNVSPPVYERFLTRILAAIKLEGVTPYSLRWQQLSRDEDAFTLLHDIAAGDERRVVYIEAKRHRSEHAVTAEEVSSFSDNLKFKHAEQGIFITTSRATDEAKKLSVDQRVILIDGAALIGLMVDNNIGVGDEQTLTIKGLDNTILEEG